MNCSPCLAIAALLLSLTAGTWILYKVQKENLGTFFKVIAWFVIAVSFLGMICFGVRAFCYQYCYGGSGGCYSTASCSRGGGGAGCCFHGKKYKKFHRTVSFCCQNGGDGFCCFSGRYAGCGNAPACKGDNVCCKVRKNDNDTGAAADADSLGGK